MKPFLLLLSTLALATAATAGPSTMAAGDWHVAGEVASFAFTLNCRFKTEGQTLGGECRDASTNDPKVQTGKVHPLTAGTVNGDRVSWMYRSSFLFSTFDVTFDGVQAADRMTGTITVQGHKGDFTATRP